MRRMLVVLVMVIVAGAIRVPGALAGQPAEITIASLSPGTAWYVYGVAMAEALKKALPADAKVEVLPQAGGVGNAKLVAQGKANFGLSFSLTNQWALQGKHAYDKKLDMLRGVAGGMDTYYLSVTVRADAGFAGLADLKEKRGKLALGSLPVGSGSEYGARNILEILGMTYDDVRKAGGSVAFTGYPNLVTGMKDGRINTVISVITPGHPSIREMSLQSDVRFLPLPPDVVAKMREQFNYAPQNMPAGMFHGMDKDVSTVGYPTVLITRADVPEDLVYLVTKTIAENKAALVAAHKGLSQFEPSAAWKPELVGLPLHPGAARYYREKGWLK